MKHVFNSTGHELVIPGVTNSEGVYVYDSSGKRYMDLEAGVWCLSLGHTNHRLNKVMTDQMNSLMQCGFCYSHAVVDEAAGKLLQVTGMNNGRAVFLCSGSEGIEYCRQIARHLTGKSVSLTLHDSYLGSYSSLSRRDRGWYQFNWEQCCACSNKEACDMRCEHIRAIPDDISEFIFEPGSSGGFVRFPPEALIHTIIQKVKSNGGKIIANEVTTGTGRTGKWWGFQHYMIQPDMVAAGKGIGNGYPVSAAVLCSAIVEELDRKPFRYAQSHQNDALGASVANEVITQIEENSLIQKAEGKGHLFMKQLGSLINGKTVTAVRGRGLMFCVDLADAAVTETVFKQLVKAGYIVGNRKTGFRIDPPLIITEEEFSGFVDTLRKCISDPSL